MSDHVLVEQRPSAGTRHPAAAGTTIGRENCDITLADTEVSRRHAQLVTHPPSALAIEDLGSTNGTYLNGKRLTAPAPLRAGDVITMGDSELHVEVVPDAGATRARTTPPAAGATTATPTPDPSPTPAVAAQPPGSGGARGDVPAPAPASASRVHQTLPPVSAPPRTQFAPDTSSSGTRRGSAATRTEATVISYGVVLTTAVAIVVYLVQRG